MVHQFRMCGGLRLYPYCVLLEQNNLWGVLHQLCCHDVQCLGYKSRYRCSCIVLANTAAVGSKITVKTEVGDNCNLRPRRIVSFPCFTLSLLLISVADTWCPRAVSACLSAAIRLPLIFMINEVDVTCKLRHHI